LVLQLKLGHANCSGTSRSAAFSAKWIYFRIASNRQGSIRCQARGSLPTSRLRRTNPKGASALSRELTSARCAAKSVNLLSETSRYAPSAERLLFLQTRHVSHRRRTAHFRTFHLDWREGYSGRSGAPSLLGYRPVAGCPNALQPFRRRPFCRYRRPRFPYPAGHR